MLRPTSDRERRLWLWAMTVVVAIYSTVGLAGTLRDQLRGHGLVGISFAAAFVLVLAAIAGSALKRRPGKRELWVGLGLAAVYGMVIVRMGIGPEERTHLFEYGLLAVLIHQALTERRSNGARVPVPGVLAVLVTVLLGWFDEGLQALFPDRVYDLRDVGTNTVAALGAVVASTAIAWARRQDLFRRGSPR